MPPPVSRLTCLFFIFLTNDPKGPHSQYVHLRNKTNTMVPHDKSIMLLISVCLVGTLFTYRSFSLGVMLMAGQD